VNTLGHDREDCRQTSTASLDPTVLTLYVNAGNQMPFNAATVQAVDSSLVVPGVTRQSSHEESEGRQWLE